MKENVYFFPLYTLMFQFFKTEKVFQDNLDSVCYYLKWTNFSAHMHDYYLWLIYVTLTPLKHSLDSELLEDRRRNSESHRISHFY